MKQSESKHPDLTKVIDSVFNLAYGDHQEIKAQTPGEISAALKVLGVDTEPGWQAVQGMMKAAEGKMRLAAARVARTKSQGRAAEPTEIRASAKAIFDEIMALVSMSGGQSAVFARKAESMSLEDLVSLRDQLIKTAARAAAKKPRNEG